MHIVLAGATGFLGRPLVDALARDGHAITVLTRGSRTAATASRDRVRFVSWTPDGTSTGSWARELDGADAIINLAGESIAGKRWSAAHKQRIVDSRRLATRSLVAAIAATPQRTPLLLNGSAVGYYGPHGDEIVTEETPAGDDFLAHVCKQWEAEATAAASANTRVVLLRTGLVLEKDGGALPQMLLPFKLGAGGPVGSGRQYWPWIHRDDWIGLVRWILQTPQSGSGAINATAPNPVTNAEFARALGRALRRPAFMPAPGFALKLLLGEMADALLLSGQRAIPRRAEQAGFTFRYRQLDDALKAIFG